MPIADLLFAALLALPSTISPIALNEILILLVIFLANLVNLGPKRYNDVITLFLLHLRGSSTVLFANMGVRMGLAYRKSGVLGRLSSTSKAHARKTETALKPFHF